MGVIDWARRRWAKVKAEAEAKAAADAAVALERAIGADGRLDRAFRQFESGAISLDDYADAVAAEANALEDREAALDRDADAAMYEFELEDIEQDRQAIKWRERWIDDQRRVASISSDNFGASGKWARFDYADSQGKQTKRSITMWEKRGAYIVGYDRARKEERTFRQDRISNWVCG